MPHITNEFTVMHINYQTSENTSDSSLGRQTFYSSKYINLKLSEDTYDVCCRNHIGCKRHNTKEGNTEMKTLRNVLETNRGTKINNN